MSEHKSVDIKKRFKISELISLIGNNDYASVKASLGDYDDEHLFEMITKISLELLECKIGKKLSELDENILLVLNNTLNKIGYNLSSECKTRDVKENMLLFKDVSNDKFYCEIRENNFPDYFIEYTVSHSGHDNYKRRYMLVLNGYNSKYQSDRKQISDYHAIHFNGNKKYTIKFERNVPT